MREKIKSIHVTAYEYFDRMNGNSYFSGIIVINKNAKGEKVLTMPFQYGYGSSFEYEALRVIKKNINKKIVKQSETSELFRFCSENNIVLASKKIEGCSQKQCKEVVA